MTIYVCTLLIFAVWTVVILLGSVGQCWSGVLTGRTGVNKWNADEVQGSRWYRRGGTDPWMNTF